MSYSLTKINKNNYRYNRSSSFEYDLLCKKISSRYNNNNNTIVTSSGTSSLNLILKSLFIKYGWNKINIIYGWELYYETPLLFEYYEDIYPGENLNIYDTVITSEPETDNEYLLELFNKKNIKNSINILFIESCSNMSGWCLDFKVIKKLRKLSKKLYVIVDNTWLTSTIFNPFEYDIDIVITSLSKHYSGGKCIGGALIIKDNDIFNVTKNHYKLSGEHVSSHICSVILENMEEMNHRIEKTSIMALKIANYLDSKDTIDKVEYPLLKTHNTFKLKDIYFKKNIGPNIFSFLINEKKEIVKEKFENMNILNLKTSYGGEDTRIDSAPVEENDKTWCRISIGYNDDYSKIIDGLNEILMDNI